jgi:uncharacterized protein YndB with AHSA1/START domain
MKMHPDERQSVETFEIRKEIEIAAPIELAFEAVLEELGLDGKTPDGGPCRGKVEAWPGGRDPGKNAGHSWGHVQVMKPPTLLEICGPMSTSYPALHHVEYRLKAEGARTRLTLVHRVMGLPSLPSLSSRSSSGPGAG